MNITYKILLWIIFCAGLLATAVSAYYLRIDWHELEMTYVTYTQSSHAQDIFILTKAYDQQNIFRINCFAEGVGALLGLIITAIAANGLAVGSTITCRNEDKSAA